MSLSPEDIFSPVEYEILESGYGYLKNRILVEFDSQGSLLPTYDNIYGSIKNAIDYFNTAQVPGVIVDIRDNPGGYDRLAALFAGFFYDHTDLYEHASFYNPQSGQFEVIGSFTIYLEPQPGYYSGPVICLVNTGTSSSAEGVAMAVQRLAQGHVLGFYGTNGSFGLTSGETLMPGGLSVSYPLGRSLDINFDIQLDSDSTKYGGVIPDIRVQLTRDNMNAVFIDSEDAELNEAVAYLDGLTSIAADRSSNPGTVQLYPNYPNPFNAKTIIRWYLPKSMHVELSVYNVKGQKINTLVNGNRKAGDNTTVWNSTDVQGRSVASGVYYYKITTNNLIDVGKMVLVK